MEVEVNEAEHLPAPEDYHEANKEDETPANLREFLTPKDYNDPNEEETRSDVREFLALKDHHEPKEEDTRSDVREFSASGDHHNVMAIRPTRPGSTVGNAEISSNQFMNSGQHLIVKSLSLLVYVSDIGSDILLACNYFANKKYVCFGATIAFVGIPAVMLTIYTSVKLPILLRGKHVPLWKRNLHIVLLALQMSPIIWYIEYIEHIIELRRFDGYGNLQLRIRFNKHQSLILSVIRVFEVAFESLPQLLLQITILLTEVPSTVSIYQYMSLSTSFVGTVWTITSYLYTRSTVFTGQSFHDTSLPWVEILMVILHVIPFLVCRIFAVSGAATVYPLGTLCVCFIHWCFFTLLWKHYSVTISDENPPQTDVVDDFWKPSIMGFVWILYPLPNFSSLRLPTRNVSILYYSLTFFENALSMAVWIVFYDHIQPLRVLLPTLVMGGFFLSLIVWWMYIVLIVPVRDNKAHDWLFVH